MDDGLKILLISLAVVLGLFAVIGFGTQIGWNAREIQFRETIKTMDNKTACGYQCGYLWPGSETRIQYSDCLNYCDGGKNNG